MLLIYVSCFVYFVYLICYVSFEFFVFIFDVEEGYGVVGLEGSFIYWKFKFSLYEFVYLYS